MVDQAYMQPLQLNDDLALKRVENILRTLGYKQAQNWTSNVDYIQYRNFAGETIDPKNITKSTEFQAYIKLNPRQDNDNANLNNEPIKINFSICNFGPDKQISLKIQDSKEEGLFQGSTKYYSDEPTSSFNYSLGRENKTATINAEPTSNATQPVQKTLDKQYGPEALGRRGSDVPAPRASLRTFNQTGETRAAVFEELREKGFGDLKLAELSNYKNIKGFHTTIDTIATKIGVSSASIAHMLERASATLHKYQDDNPTPLTRRQMEQMTVGDLVEGKIPPHFGGELSKNRRPADHSPKHPQPH